MLKMKIQKKKKYQMKIEKEKRIYEEFLLKKKKFVKSIR